MSARDKRQLGAQGGPGLTEVQKDLILDSMSEMLVYYDLDLRILWANRSAAESVGVEPQDLIGRHCHEVWRDRENACPARPAVRAGDEPYSREVTSPDGRYWHVRGYPVRDSDGNVTNLLEFCQEITEQRVTERALAESEEKYRDIVENAPTAIFRSTVSGRLLDVNPTGARMFGYDSVQETVDACTDLAAALFVCPEQREGMIRQVSEAEGFVRFENDYRRKDGSTFVANLYMRAVRKNGKTEFVEGFVEDITDRRRMEEEKRQFYRDTVLSVTEGKMVLAVDDECAQYLDESRYTASIGGYRDIPNLRHEVRDHLVGSGWPPDAVADLVSGLGEAMNNAIKHAGSGTVFAGSREDAMWAGVTDTGAGISTLALPGAALRRGYSTKVSMGMGYSIMLDVTDRVILNTDTHGTKVVLVKYAERDRGPLILEDLPDTWEAEVM